MKFAAFAVSVAAFPSSDVYYVGKPYVIGGTDVSFQAAICGACHLIPTLSLSIYQEIYVLGNHGNVHSVMTRNNVSLPHLRIEQFLQSSNKEAEVSRSKMTGALQ